MKKIATISILISLYAIYSGWVYTRGTDIHPNMSASAIEGRRLWQVNNCQTCHQLYGLGGYMGPDLTFATTDKNRGVLYAKGILLGGGSRMPNFHFTTKNADNIIDYLAYVSTTAVTLTK